MSAMSGILIVTVSLLSFIVLIGLFETQILNSGLLTLIAFMGIGAIITYRLSRPSALERIIQVYDIRSNMSMVVLRISNPAYTDELLRLNPMAAKPLET